jgi:hypothetical protein
MVSKSIITARTDCTIKDKLNNKDNNNNTNNSSSSELVVEVHGVNHQQYNNKNKTKSKFNSEKKFQGLREKPILSPTENVLLAIANETVVSSHLPSSSSQVWKYAIRCPNSNYATCCLCPDNKQISTNNGSTSTLRKHLISKHNIHELVLSDDKRRSTKSSLISIKKKQALHGLFIDCIIMDGRTFNDLHKPGMKKILQELIPGRFLLK